MRRIVSLVIVVALAVASYWLFAHRVVQTPATLNPRMKPVAGLASTNSDTSDAGGAIPKQSAAAQAGSPTPSNPYALYATATDLFPLAQEFRERAEHGDPDVAAALAELEDECMMYVGSHGDRSGVPRSWQEKWDLGAKPWIDAMLARTNQRCQRFTLDDLIPRKRLQKWVSDAANNGNAEAKARELLLNTQIEKIPDVALAETVRDILNSGNPAAIAQLSDVMGAPVQNRDDPEKLFGFPAGTDIDPSAYLIAACRLGYDCGPGSRILDNLCFGGIGCGYSSVDAIVKDRMLTPAQYRAMQQEVPVILGKIGHH